MSGNKGNKNSNKDISVPPAAHVRTPRNPNDSVEYPKAANKQDSEKDGSLEWLKEADAFEAEKKNEQEDPKDEKKGSKKEGEKMEASDETNGSLDWLIKAADYEPLN
ncbi:hypothetical protein CIB48_g12279 [Xylaria polymorpha]|nr:hypothetical protein CIB48_g12279 [Xylaria polymorpha]